MSAIAISAGRVVTMQSDPEAAANPLGVLEDTSMVVEAGRIAWVGPTSKCPAADRHVDARDAVVTPGLCDAHTHAAWTGSRHAEYALKVAGRDYREIAAAGGGIKATHHAIASASEETLAEELTARLRRMARLGVTTCEVKSGYGLEPELEKKQLRAIARVALDTRLPKVVPTLLALHAVPNSARDRALYIEGQIALVREIGALGLARYVDAYIDGNAFSVAETRPLLEVAKASRFDIRLHVGQFTEIGGAKLAADLGAHSVDHMEHCDESSLGRLQATGTHVGLLPIASFVLGQRPPDVPALRAAGLPFFVASDANPGTAPTESLPLAMSLALRLYGLTPEEVLRGATVIAGASLGLPERGRIVQGGPADLVVWDLPHELAIVQPWGTPRTRLVLRDGVTIAEG